MYTVYNTTKRRWQAAILINQLVMTLGFLFPVLSGVGRCAVVITITAQRCNPC